jgi:hypothetical protein
MSPLWEMYKEGIDLNSIINGRLTIKKCEKEVANVKIYKWK